VKTLCALAVTALLSWTAAAQGPDHPKGPDCRDCHTVENPTKAKPSLRKCPRNQMRGYHSLSEAVETIRFEGSGEYGPVDFPHKTHAAMAEMDGGCASCHHYDQSRAIEKCSACHSAEREREDLGKPDLKAAMHRACMDCHARWGGSTQCGACHGANTHGAPSKRPGPEHARAAGLACAACHKAQECADCHSLDKDEAARKLKVRPGHVDWPLNRFHRALDCRACHKAAGSFTKLNKDCEACHKGWQKTFDHKKTGLELDATHAGFECENCHADKIFTAPPACGSCHERSYPKDKPGKLVSVGGGH
jgi:hypothetical protein